MFSFFKKKKENNEADNIESALTYYVKDDGEVFIDVNLIDYSTKTINNFAKVLAGISSLRFQLQTIDMVKHGFVESGKIEEFENLLTQIVLISKQEIESITGINNKDKGEDPCIKPSDMI
jgi:hypothetical protein